VKCGKSTKTVVWTYKGAPPTNETFPKRGQENSLRIYRGGGEPTHGFRKVLNDFGCWDGAKTSPLKKTLVRQGESLLPPTKKEVNARFGRGKGTGLREKKPWRAHSQGSATEPSRGGMETKSWAEESGFPVPCNRRQSPEKKRKSGCSLMQSWKRNRTGKEGNTGTS